MGVFDRQIASALRMIDKYGETCTWRSRVQTGGTAAKPGGTTETPHTVKIAFLPVDREYLMTFMARNQLTQEPSGLMQGFMGQVDFTPGLKDGVVRSSGEVINVVDDNGIEVIDPNGEGVILYIMRFAR
jgi:hypothetical protein